MVKDYLVTNYPSAISREISKDLNSIVNDEKRRDESTEKYLTFGEDGQLRRIKEESHEGHV
jgi:hypothetical protein